jgi:hypothetical protein
MFPFPLPAQIQHRSIVPLLVALPHRRLSFPEPRAELVPFVVRVAEPILLLTARTFHRLLVQQRVYFNGSPMHDFGERDRHTLTSQHLLSLFHQCDYPRQMLTKFRRYVGRECHYG